MDLGKYFIWILFIITAYGLLFVIKYLLRKRDGWVTRVIFIVVESLAAIIIAFLIIAFNSIIAWHGAMFFAALYIAFFAGAASDLLTIPFVRKKDDPKTFKIRTIVSILCLAAFALYGTVNMQIVNPHYMTISSEKLKNEYKIVFLADFHLGSSQSMETVRNTVRQIGEEEPDLILLGGDITDEYTEREELEEVYSLFGELEAPVFFIYGNHDRQPLSVYAGGRTYSDEELISALETNGIQVLEDEWIEFSEDLVLMGRDDVSTGIDRIDLDEIKPRPEDEFVILLDHSPYETEDTIASGADLQLSGHTHAGQLFPLQFIYNLLGYDAYGFYHHGETEIYVSAGASGWRIPFRTEAHCQYDVIELLPEN